MSVLICVAVTAARVSASSGGALFLVFYALLCGSVIPLKRVSKNSYTIFVRPYECTVPAGGRETMIPDGISQYLLRTLLRRKRSLLCSQTLNEIF